ncbi:MAG: Fis family transcriptional regulator, partial [Desulfobacterales bacterium]|nr:Fis family transcriptional regulator [Desulfobacterales bacterium]
EDGSIIRVGGTAGRSLDVRILAATNRELEAMVERKEFRRDLYYRLNVIPLRVPPLREREECILSLIHHFLGHFAARLGKKKRLRLTRSASDALLAHPYPGNVRELMNLCERLVVMAEGERITLDDLPGPMASPHPASPRASAGPAPELWNEEATLRQILAAAEREALARAMEAHRTQANAAKALGVNQSTIARKLKKHGLR